MRAYPALRRHRRRAWIGRRCAIESIATTRTVWPGLSDHHGDFGAKRFLSPAQEGELAEWVRRGPNLAEYGVVRWRLADLARVIEATVGVALVSAR